MEEIANNKRKRKLPKKRRRGFRPAPKEKKIRYAQSKNLDPENLMKEEGKPPQPWGNNMSS